MLPIPHPRQLERNSQTDRKGGRFACVLVALAAVALFLSGCASTGEDTSRTFSTVVIDAGHGGYDSGAHPSQRVAEKHVTLAVAKRLETKLKAAGFRTIMTRQTDVFVPLGVRTRISNRERNAIFVSIHFNYSRKRSIQGIETYYHRARDRDFAIAVETGAVSRTGANRRGVIRANFYVLRHNYLPAVLVECGYLTNWSEAKRAASPDYQEALAEGISQALINRRRSGGGMVLGAGSSSSGTRSLRD